jgi:hypothetical protein
MKLAKHFANLLAVGALGASALLLSSSTVACGGGSSSGGGTTGFGCSQSIAGNQFCYVYTNLTSSEQTQEQQACTMGGGSVVTSCPSANKIGCCAVTQGGVSFDQCYYFGSASTDQQACTMAGGTWSSM